MMKKIITTATILTLSVFSVSTFANPARTGEFKENGTGQHKHHKKCYLKNSGFVDTTQKVSSISDANNWKDDQFIILQGKIVKQVGKDDFLIRDQSGEMEVEIEKKAWCGVKITPNDEIKLYGEVDKSWNKTEVEIEHIEKVQ